MLSLAVFLPALGMLAVLAVPARHLGALRALALATSGATLALWLGLWWAFDPATAGLQFEQDLPWIAPLGVRYHLGVDGLSAPLLVMTALLMCAALAFSWPQRERAKAYYACFLLLETASLGVFAAADLFLFYVFWDLNLVAMYFIIALWGHAGARTAALEFFLYTLVGSLALLVGIITLCLAAEPLTTDLVRLRAQLPLLEGGAAQLAFFALLLGFAIKLPAVPLHTWLPPAHAEAPAAGSAILAGVLLKMGGYGLLRILLPLLPHTAQRYAPWLAALGVLAALYGALAALGQQHFKRMLAYTSINHMGYVLLAVGALAAARGPAGARELAWNGAVIQMVSHGLITGALFLLSGALWRRTHSFEMDDLGGLARPAPALAAVTAFAAFAALGLPGLSGFVAEFQIFVGVFRIYPLAALAALTGILITAGLFLRALQRVFLGPTPPRWQDIRDLERHEYLALAPLLALILLIGLAPFWLVEVTRSAAALGAGMP